MSTIGKTHVPAEVLSAILTHLFQNELRNASRVSRAFYRAAHDAGLFLHRSVHSERQVTLDTFSEVVQYAKAQRYMFRLGLNLVIIRRNEETTAGVPLLQDIWDSLRGALPLLVRLHIRLYSALLAPAYSALDGPAGQLRTLSVLVLDDEAKPAPIPPALSGGTAPRLHTVELKGPVLPHTPARIPAWSSVRALSVYARYPAQQLFVSAYFPALVNLTVEVWPRPNLLVLDLVGLALNSLTIKNDSGVPIQYASDPSKSPPRIRTFNDVCRALHYDERHWPDAKVPLNAHIQQTVYDLGRGKCMLYKLTPGDLLSAYDIEKRVYTGAVISVGSADGSCDWRITQYAKPLPLSVREAPTLSGALDALPPLRARLVSLIIEDALLVRLLQTPRTLDALRELLVDCTVVPAPPPRWNWVYAPHVFAQSAMALRQPLLRCPALERAVVFATGRETPVSVCCERIRALGLLRDDACVALVLARVMVDYGGDRGSRVQDIFSSLHVEGNCVPNYYQHRDDNPRLSG